MPGLIAAPAVRAWRLSAREGLRDRRLVNRRRCPAQPFLLELTALDSRHRLYRAAMPGNWLSRADPESSPPPQPSTIGLCRVQLATPQEYLPLRTYFIWISSDGRSKLRRRASRDFQPRPLKKEQMIDDDPLQVVVDVAS
jgi:hypothetical protein